MSSIGMLDSSVVPTTVPVRAATYGLIHLFLNMMHLPLPCVRLLSTPVGPLLPRNIPDYRAHGKYKTAGDPIDTGIHHFLIGAAMGLLLQHPFSICPSIIKFSDPTKTVTTLNLSNIGFSDAEFASTHFPWMVYGGGTGHFLSTIVESTLPFDITLAADTTVYGRGFIRHLVRYPPIVGGLEDMIKAVMSNIEFSIARYITHSPIHGITPSQYE